ncbi:hypothetical protein J4Q44_G00217480 [Coregonus suidteri]|uniref:Tastin n=1 Tax=Coregonus suidteri TaxID=861788 RepID=A0AAN8LB22_9TELE
MDSSQVLRQQSQNKILNDHSSLNRMTADPKPGSKHPSLPHPSKHPSVPHGHPTKLGSENKDPAAVSDNSTKPPVRPLGISRLPVLAKSLPLQTPSDFTLSHKRWEENSLAGKTKRKKPSTKPVPFNFSNPKANRMGAQNQRGPLATTARAGAQPTQPESTFSIAGHLKTRPTSTTATLPSTVPTTHNKAQSKSTVELAAQIPTHALHLAARKAGQGPGGILPQQNRETRKPHLTQAPSAATSMSLSQHPKLKAQSSSENPLHVSGLGQLGLSRPPSSFAHGSGLSSSAVSISSASTASAQPTALSTEACRGHFDMLSLKDRSMPGQLPSSTAGSVAAAFHSDPSALRSILQNEGVSAAKVFMSSRPSTQAYYNMPQRVSIMKSGQKTVLSAGPVRNVQFYPDPVALGSILQNEGVSYPLQPQRVSVMKGHQMTAASAGPVRSVQFSPEPSSLSSMNEGVSYPLQPQRVSVMKGRQKSAASAGPVRSVQFSPDPAALSSILQNERVKAGRPLEATPQRTSACPSGRGTSIYTAQRVPITKWHTEAPGGPMVTSVSQTPALKWTPQRVPDTRHQPMSMRRLLSAHQTPYSGSPRLRGLQGHNRDLETCKEEVVQRLFKETEDQEEEERTDGVALDQDPAETRADQQLAKEEEQSNTGGRLQTFFQAPHRESVIFFSTGKKLHRAAPAHEQESPVAGFLERGARAAGAQEAMDSLPLQPELDRASAPEIPEVTAAVSDLTRLTNLSAFVPLSQPRGSIMFPKSGALSSATALLRRRLPLLKELRLDEEVATYTSSPALPPSSSWPQQTRCGNPVAAALYLQDYASFQPIILVPSSTSCSSPLRER